MVGPGPENGSEMEGPTAGTEFEPGESTETSFNLGYREALWPVQPTCPAFQAVISQMIPIAQCGRLCPEFGKTPRYIQVRVVHVLIFGHHKFIASRICAAGVRFQKYMQKRAGCDSSARLEIYYSNNK